MSITATKRQKKDIPRKICTSCGRELPLTTGFYSSKSPLFAIDGRVNICKDCFIKNSLNEDGTINEEKFKQTLRQMDKPYYSDYIVVATQQYLSENSYVTDKDVQNYGAEIIRLYMKNIASLRQLSGKNYADSEKDGFVQSAANLKKQPKVDDEPEPIASHKTSWTKKDKQNMKYVISTIGYDPYEYTGLDDADRKYCFNILSGYCDTDGIADDGHKLQGVIEMAMLFCQCKKLTETMNIELANPDVDETKIQKLTSAKKALLDSIASIAKDNNISSNYNKNSKQGKNSLTSKMKEMEANGFQEISVNFFDIKTAEAFKQIDEISNNNIASQLALDNNDYADIVKEQREMIQKYEMDLGALQEENRMLKNQIIDLENRKR